MCTIHDGWEMGQFAPPQPLYTRIGSQRRYGVELEYQHVPDDYQSLEGETVFGAKEDCSVSGGEFDSPILFGDQGLRVCEDFCKMGKDNNFGVGTGAGFHLHVDMTHEEPEALKRIALAYHYTKDFWYAVIPDHRRENEYSMSHRYGRNDVLSWENLNEVSRFAMNYERYTWVNWSSYTSKKTVELRCHETTLDAPTIIHWIIAHTRFCDNMKDTKVGSITRAFQGKKLDDLFREMRSVFQNPDTSEHFSKRYRSFC